MQKNNHDKLWVLILSSILVVVIWVANYLLLRCSSDKSALGDLFGASNSLFTGLAFACVIYTIYIQRIDLKKTGEELRLQNFENSFFHLLSLHNDIVSSVRFQLYSDKEPFIGRKCFERLYNQLSINYEINKKSTSNDDERVNVSYQDFFDTYQAELGHYFRNIYRIVKYVDMSNIYNKSQYIGILRAQLSSYELCLLFYNCVSPYGKEKFRPLVEKY